jgi:hypothetical protein
MALMNTLKSLFGGKPADSDSAGVPAAKPEENVEYNNCVISPTPIKEGSQYRTAGTISNPADNRETQFIRADNHSSRDQAVEHSITKAKQIIDERGASLFDSERC